MSAATPTDGSERFAGVATRSVSYLGKPFTYPVGSGIGQCIANGDEWDAAFRTILPILLPQDEPQICEVGSNIGASLLQILAVKPAARVVALEPSDRFRAFLERNLDLAGYHHIEVLPLAAGREVGSAILHSDATSGSLVAPGNAGGMFGDQPIEVTTLETVLSSRGQIDFIKIDTDGLDFEVLRGASGVLTRDRPVIHFEFCPVLCPSPPIIELRWLQSLGYKRIACLDPGGHLVGISDDPETLIQWAEERYYCDLIACPDGEPGAARLDQAVGTRKPAGSPGERTTIEVADGLEYQVIVPDWADDLVSDAFRLGAHPFAHITDILQELLEPGDFVLDLGAHIGSFSLLAGTLGCRGVAVEASPANASRLTLNLAINRFHDRFSVVSAAVGDGAGIVEFASAGLFGMVDNPLLTPGSVRADTLATTSVHQMTVDGLLDEMGVERVDFIKLDVEGSEIAAIRGMSELLSGADAPPILFESNGHTLRHFGATPNDLLAMLDERGYTSYRLEQGRLIPIDPTRLQPECTVDYLALKSLPGNLRGDRVGTPMTEGEIVDRVVSESRFEHEHVRAYTARALEHASESIRSHPRILAAMARLRSDKHVDVRKAASWYVPSPGQLEVREKDSVATELRAPWIGPSVEPGPGGDVSQRFGYTRLCNLEDFEEPRLRDLIRTIYEFEVTADTPEFPRGRVHRKLWEVAMAVRTLGDLGSLHEQAEILGVGAGTEATVFWLTNTAARVYATDLYLDPGVWEREAAESMLQNPGHHWSGRWNPQRLVVQHMNALDLQYEDESFDGIFSSSSIEHFGTLEDVKTSAQEMFRVLKPGGILSLSTEFLLDGRPPGVPGVLMFTPEMIREYIVGDLAWAPVAPVQLTLSESTLNTEQPLILDRPTAFPHIVLRHEGRLFTSVHLALRKLTM